MMRRFGIEMAGARRLVLALAACGLAALSVAPRAGAAIEIEPGSVVGKCHEYIPLAELPPITIPGKVPGFEREIDLAAVKSAESLARAGSHPDCTGGGRLEFEGGIIANAARDFIFDTPPGFLGNPTVVPPCDREAFRNVWALDGDRRNGCAPASQVGVVMVTYSPASVVTGTQPVYRLTPSEGVPASFGFPIGGVSYIINANLRTDGDYGLHVNSLDLTTGAPLIAAYLTFWGDPANPIHDPERWDPHKPGSGTPANPQGDWGAVSGLPRKPFIQAPADCNATNLVSRARVRSWMEPERWVPENPFDPVAMAPAPPPTDCEKLSFKPGIELVPSAKNSDSPTGVSVQMDVPQNYDPAGLSTPPLKKAVVTLPEGMSVNPAAADGIEGCSSEQIGLLSTEGAYPNPTRFAKGEASCPQASKVGRLTVKTALLEEELHGDVYLATPYDNPFKSLLAIYLVIRGPGFVVKVPGRVEPDPLTGRLVSTFDHSPQLPFDELDIDFFGGPRAPLATSPLCGTQEILTELTPWSAPQSGPPASPDNRYASTRGPAGAPCSHSLAERPFSPELTAGTGNPIAGGFSPLTMRLTRPDGHQPLAGLTVKPPSGFTAVLKGMATCTEAQIAQAASRGPNGGGRLESHSPSCPAESKVGHVLTGAGAGPTPLYTEGSAYLAGPYKGAPLSLAVITPALAGGSPGKEVFDLGTVVVRVALHIDSKDAQVLAVSDPVPQTLQGIPLRIRDIRVVMDRPKWGVNPTSCAEKTFEVTAEGQNGASVELSNRFQVVECANLGFKPPLKLTLKGGTKRGAHPSLRAVLRPRPGDANIHRASVALSSASFLDQSHIRTICTRVQFRAEACPKASIYGKATAWSPLLEEPLSGPVYLRSSENPLPDLLVDLRGPERQPIRVELSGRVDSVKGAIRTTFEATPDAQVEKFVLEMQGGKRGLIVNSRNLCKTTNRSTNKFTAHNGRTFTSRPPVIPLGCKKASKQQKRRGHSR